MLKEIKQIEASANLLYPESEVENAIDNMAAQINIRLKDKNPVILCVMNGGIVVSGKLLTRLTMPCTVDTINASRYCKQTLGGQIKWIQKPQSNLKDRTVLIIDDVLDEGFTLQAIIQYCQQQYAKATYSAVLVNKILNHKKPITADFIGLDVENRYLFGYGMDYKGYLRNAPGIFACSP
ncbi:MAG: hypoxanthine-guanine phosphoribosyltransferase [Methylococcales symbiont of Iophon sp. n. MRB-2018]|nr:MAG: hypoxanthine-guanine phosphoribosyltransferase [Methylococcales symbiont of Iophon sp. n. MRB-2018]KAF3979173.1 MAG: hypoxanthine-guanine phosphoribosyltransferase [Methylococcales symbiont of Iophon sp. n. MRB-2018]